MFLNIKIPFNIKITLNKTMHHMSNPKYQPFEEHTY